MTKTTIDGLTIEIEPNEGRDGVNCYISKGRFSASLACLEDTGLISWGDKADYIVPARTIERIRVYAEKHCY